MPPEKLFFIICLAILSSYTLVAQVSFSDVPQKSWLTVKKSQQFLISELKAVDSPEAESIIAGFNDDWGYSGGLEKVLGWLPYQYNDLFSEDVVMTHCAIYNLKKRVRFGHVMQMKPDGTFELIEGDKNNPKPFQKWSKTSLGDRELKSLESPPSRDPVYQVGGIFTFSNAMGWRFTAMPPKPPMPLKLDDKIVLEKVDYIASNLDEIKSGPKSLNLAGSTLSNLSFLFEIAQGNDFSRSKEKFSIKNASSIEGAVFSIASLHDWRSTKGLEPPVTLNPDGNVDHGAGGDVFFEAWEVFNGRLILTTNKGKVVAIPNTDDLFTFYFDYMGEIYLAMRHPDDYFDLVDRTMAGNQ